MTESPRASTQVSAIIKAARKAVYQACLDPDALAAWRVPDSMKGEVHVFEAREGGMYRMSLTYQDPAQAPGGKTSRDTDTFQGRFVEMVPDEKIVEMVVFETEDPRFAGDMKITTRFADTDEGTRVTILCENIRRVFGRRTMRRAVDNPCGSWPRSSSPGARHDRNRDLGRGVPIAGARTSPSATQIPEAGRAIAPVDVVPAVASTGGRAAALRVTRRSGGPRSPRHMRSGRPRR
jgi:uncharacterized protein YndB with AHSA1/START domain